MNIAVVKSQVYQDLWVCDISNDPFELYKTSLVRSPPIGLAETYKADFIIVKESDDYPCQFNKNCLPDEFKNNMKFSLNLKNPCLPFLDETYHKHTSIDAVSHSVDDIEWQKYSIVLCVNTCVPDRIIEKNPRTLWCYWIGENNWELMEQRIGKYDIILNQDVTRLNLPEFSVGFPYSYIGPYTMENLGKSLLNVESIHKQGIYMEINNTEERPVVKIPNEFFRLSDHLSMTINVHSQNILENAKRICKSKYFVKILGRVIRGNGLLECISAGTLILANRSLVILDSLVLPECHVVSVKDICHKIAYFEENPQEYRRCVEMQREILEKDYFKGPFDKVLEKYQQKLSLQEGIYTALIIEPRKHKAMAFVLQNFLENLDSRWRFIIYHGTENLEWLNELIDSDDFLLKNRYRIEFRLLPYANLTLNQYSSIMANPDFIRSIPTEMFLVFQTDTMICKPFKDTIYNFMEYDYVGAPWNYNLQDSITKGQVGNGGLSLRRKSKMLEIALNVRYNLYEFHEDAYFSGLLGHIHVNKPDYTKASTFSIETVYSPQAFGIHKCWGWTKEVTEEQCPGYGELLRLCEAGI